MSAAPKRLQLALSLWLVAFAVHNTEELLLGLPAWMLKYAHLPWHLQPDVFLSATLVLEATALLAVFAVVGFKKRWAKWAIMGIVGGTLVNVVSHALLTIWAGRYCPGLATALLAVLPTGLWAWHELNQLDTK